MQTVMIKLRFKPLEYITSYIFHIIVFLWKENYNRHFTCVTSFLKLTIRNQCPRRGKSSSSVLRSSKATLHLQDSWRLKYFTNFPWEWEKYRDTHTQTNNQRGTEYKDLERQRQLLVALKTANVSKKWAKSVRIKNCEHILPYVVEPFWLFYQVRNLPSGGPLRHLGTTMLCKSLKQVCAFVITTCDGPHLPWLSALGDVGVDFPNGQPLLAPVYYKRLTASVILIFS